MESNHESIDWVPLAKELDQPDNDVQEVGSPSIAQLSTRRYPFDVQPARTWPAWFDLWELIDPPKIDYEKQGYFWSPTSADRALAWEVYIELQTRIAVQSLGDEEGDDLTALKSIYLLFPITRECLRKHGVDCSNSGTLITTFLNEKIRPFSARWHRVSEEDKWEDERGLIHQEFRKALRDVQPNLRTLASALAHLADARLD